MSDALLYSFVGSELDKMLGGGRIDKISMPNDYDIILKSEPANKTLTC